jgi:predicted RNA-binding protein with PIN domain
VNKILIDGYNLLFSLHDDIEDVERDRRTLLSYLSSYLSNVSQEILFIFDSTKNNAWHFEYHESLKVIFSPTNMSADTYILEMIQGTKHPGNITLVTADKTLAHKAKDLGAQIQTISAFLHWLEKKDPSADKEPNESSLQRKRLEKIFEKRLNGKSKES